MIEHQGGENSKQKEVKQEAGRTGRQSAEAQGDSGTELSAPPAEAWVRGLHGELAALLVPRPEGGAL